MKNAASRSEKPSTKSPRKPDDDEPKNFAIAEAPNRSARKLGAYVRLRRAVGRPAKLAKGSVGIIVSDTEGRCKPGSVAVLVPGHHRYLCLPEEALEDVKP